MSLASLSDMRATDARESVRALAERRKCWHIGSRHIRYLHIEYGDTNERLVNRFLSDMMMFLIICRERASMKTDSEWRDQVKGILKAELKRRNVSYQQLAERLAELGVHDTAANIAQQDQPRRLHGCVHGAVPRGNRMSVGET